MAFLQNGNNPPLSVDARTAVTKVNVNANPNAFHVVIVSSSRSVSDTQGRDNDSASMVNFL